MPLSFHQDKMANGKDCQILKVIDSEAPYNIDAWTKRSGDKIRDIETEGAHLIFI